MSWRHVKKKKKTEMWLRQPLIPVLYLYVWIYTLTWLEYLGVGSDEEKTGAQSHAAAHHDELIVVLLRLECGKMVLVKKPVQPEWWIIRMIIIGIRYVNFRRLVKQWLFATCMTSTGREFRRKHSTPNESQVRDTYQKVAENIKNQYAKSSCYD